MAKTKTKKAPKLTLVKAAPAPEVQVAERKSYFLSIAPTGTLTDIIAVFNEMGLRVIDEAAVQRLSKYKGIVLVGA